MRMVKVGAGKENADALEKTIKELLAEGRLALTDGREFTMNLGEFSHGNKV